MSILGSGFLPNIGGMITVPPSAPVEYMGIPPNAGGMLLNTPTPAPAPVQQQPSSAASGVKSAYTVGFPGLSDDEVAAMLGMEYTGDRDQDQMVQDAVEAARNQNAIETGTAPSQAEIDQRTAAFEDTMEQLRNDPDMREAWGIDRDTRRFDVGTILRIAASFAIPAISGALVNALNLSGTVANVTQATLEAAFSSATGGSPGGALISSFGALGNADAVQVLDDVADAVQTADQARGALDTVQDVVRFIQQVDEYGRRPEDVVEEITTGDVEIFDDTTDDDTTVDEGATDATITEDLSDDVDFSGQVDLGLFILDVLQQADFDAGKDVVLDDGTVINNRTHEQTGTGGFAGGILVTERPTPDESGGGGAGGGGGAVDTTTVETTPTDIGTEDVSLADPGAVPAGERVPLGGDATDVLIDQIKEAIEVETDDATREDLERVLDNLEETQTEDPEVVEQPQTEVFDPGTTTDGPETPEEAGADEEDDDDFFFIPSFPEEVIDVDVPDIPTTVETTEPAVETTVETTEGGVTIGTGEGTGIGTGEGTGEGIGAGEEGEGEAGTGEAGAGETGTGEEGIGDDGTGEGEGGDGTGEGEGDEDAVAKPRGMMAASRFQPYAGGGLPSQGIPFVGVPYEQKDYMVELNSLINRSLFGDAIS